MGVELSVVALDWLDRIVIRDFVIEWFSGPDSDEVQMLALGVVIHILEEHVLVPSVGIEPNRYSAIFEGCGCAPQTQKIKQQNGTLSHSPLLREIMDFVS
jgi:hypothetical protein